MTGIHLDFTEMPNRERGGKYRGGTERAGFLFQVRRCRRLRGGLDRGVDWSAEEKGRSDTMLD